MKSTFSTFQRYSFCLCIGKDLALLQAEASASGLGLANVPNVGWHYLHGLS